MYFYSGPVIGGVIGAVVPFVIGVAYYVCSFILKAREEGWRNVSLEEWKEFGKNIESEIGLLLGGISTRKPEFGENCEHCNKKVDALNNHVDELHQEINELKERLVSQVNSKVSCLSSPSCTPTHPPKPVTPTNPTNVNNPEEKEEIIEQKEEEKTEESQKE